MRALQSKTNAIAPTGEFPFGRIKDDSGNNDGVPLDEQVYGDAHQFLEKLMSDGNVTPNGLPDNETNGFQLNEALFNVSVKPSLSFLGVFAAEVEFSTTYNSPEAIEAFDVDNNDMFIAKVNGSNRSIDKVNIRTQVRTGLATSGTDSINSVSVDDTYCWILTDGATKKIRAFNKQTGTEDLTKAITLLSNIYSGFCARENTDHIYIGDVTDSKIRIFLKADGSELTSITVTNVTKDLSFNRGRLYVVNQIDNVCKVYNIDGFVLDSFTATLQPVVTMLSIQVFAGKIHCVYTEGMSKIINIFSTETLLELRSQTELTLEDDSLQSIKIGANRQFKHIKGFSPLNRIDTHKQVFPY